MIVECNFLDAAGMTVEESNAEATKRGHTSWDQLKRFVRAHPDVTFVLCHWSKRYSDEDVRSYFAEKERDLSNVVLWLDSGIVAAADG